jgi:histidine triad (HIT) family protein
MSDTIFSKIISGQIPCHKVYEDDWVLAFLDIAPLSFGHTLVIPKRFARTLDEVDLETAAALGKALVVVSRAVKAVTGCDAFNILQNNESAAHQAVMHVHFHVIPKPSEEAGLGIVWPASKLDPSSATELAARLRGAIAG